MLNIYLTPEEISYISVENKLYDPQTLGVCMAIAKASADNAVRVILDEIKNPFAYPECKEDSLKYLGFEAFRDVLKKLTEVKPC